MKIVESHYHSFINLHQLKLEVDQLADNFSNYYSGLKKVMIKHRPKICPFEDLLVHVKENDTVFDIGSGSGYFLLAAKNIHKARQCLGVEVNEGVVNTSNKVFREMDLHENEIKLIPARTPNDWPKQEFDVTSMIDVIHHIPPYHQESFLKVAMSRVKKGGIFIFKDMSNASFFYAVANRMHDLVLARQWIHYFPITKVQTLFEMNGFSLREKMQTKSLWYLHDSLIFQKN